MSMSTFCRYGEMSNDPGSHRRCHGTNCDCECHPKGEPVTTITELRDHQAEGDHTGTNGETPRITTERVACPDCGKEVKPAGLGIHRAKAHGTYSADRGNQSRRRQHDAHEAPPEPEEPEPTAADAIADAETDERGIIFMPTDDQVDILDAIGFLTGVDRYEAVSVIIDDGIAQHAKNPSVAKLVKLRNEHRA